MGVMDAIDLSFQDINPHQTSNSLPLKDFKRPSTPETDFNSVLNEMEGNGGNGIEINWDKYEVSYDCPRCLKKIFKKPYNQGSQMMWADHLTPIFNEATHATLHHSEDEEETLLEHISTCAFYYFQSPVTKFDIDYLDAVEKTDYMESIKPLLIHNFPNVEHYSKKATSEQKPSSDYGSEDSEFPLTPDIAFPDPLMDLASETEEDHLIDVESLDTGMMDALRNMLHSHNLQEEDGYHGDAHDDDLDDKNRDGRSSCNKTVNNCSNSNDDRTRSDRSCSKSRISEMHNYCSNKIQQHQHQHQQQHQQQHITKRRSEDLDDYIDDDIDEDYYDDDVCSSDIILHHNKYNNTHPLSNYNNKTSNNYNKTTNNYNKTSNNYNKTSNNYNKTSNNYNKTSNNLNKTSNNYNTLKYSKKEYNTSHNFHHKISPSSAPSPSPPSTPSSHDPRTCRSKRTPRSPSPSYHPTHSYRLKKGGGLRCRKGEEGSRRAQHNVLERQRRNNLKDLFYALKDQIPSMSSTQSSSSSSSSSFLKFTKVNTLVNAVTFIGRLHKEASAIDNNLQQLKQQHALLSQRVAGH